MDKIWNRIKYYAIGLGFGSIIVFFTFGNRGCSWLPGNRVKNMIGEKEIIIGDSIADIMTCTQIDNVAIYALLKSDGDVEFSLSETHQRPKIYYIQGEKDDRNYYAKFALYEQEPLSLEGAEYAEVVGLGWEDETQCSSEKSNSYKAVLPLPRADVMAILEAHEFRFLERAKCDLDFYGLAESDVLNFHKTAEINMEQSEPRLEPNAYYILTGIINGQTYSIQYIVGENRTRVAEIRGVETSPCVDK